MKNPRKLFSTFLVFGFTLNTAPTLAESMNKNNRIQEDKKEESYLTTKNIVLAAAGIITVAGIYFYQEELYDAASNAGTWLGGFSSTPTETLGTHKTTQSTSPIEASEIIADAKSAENAEECITKTTQLAKKPTGGLLTWFLQQLGKLFGTTSKTEADFSNEDLEKYLGNAANESLDDQSPTE